MPKFHKKLSKRVTCRHKYKVKKKVAEHNRKLRREKKKNPVKSKPKDPGVPNSLPFKEQILQEAELLKQRAKELKQLQKEKRLQQHFENRGLDVEDEGKIKKKKSGVKTASNTITQGLKLGHKNYKEIIDSADVILEVLDARDPLGCRCMQLEKEVIDANKKIVLVLNKIDLIPEKNLKMWLAYLRQELPTFPFKSATEVGQVDEILLHNNVLTIAKNEKVQFSRRRVGGKFLIQVLKKYCQDQGSDVRVKVGVVGLHNVGKSSVIYSLQCHRSGMVKPASEAKAQEVSLNQHVTLLKIPGLVLAKDISPSDLALRNSIKFDVSKDVVSIAEALFERAVKEQLMIHYYVPVFSSPSELLEMLSTKFGRFKKGGLPDLEATARQVLKEWSCTKIKYYTQPPAMHQLPKHISAEYVTNLSEAFHISAQKEINIFKEVSFIVPGECIILESEGMKKEILLSNAESENKASDVNVSEALVTVKADCISKKLPDSDDSDYDFDTDFQSIN